MCIFQSVCFFVSYFMSITYHRKVFDYVVKRSKVNFGRRGRQTYYSACIGISNESVFNNFSWLVWFWQKVMCIRVCVCLCMSCGSSKYAMSTVVLSYYICIVENISKRGTTLGVWMSVARLKKKIW